MGAGPAEQIIFSKHCKIDTTSAFTRMVAHTAWRVKTGPKGPSVCPVELRLAHMVVLGIRNMLERHGAGMSWAPPSNHAGSGNFHLELKNRSNTGGDKVERPVAAVSPSGMIPGPESTLERLLPFPVVIRWLVSPVNELYS